MRKSGEPQKQISADPIYSAMAGYREKEKRFDTLWDAMDLAQHTAREKHGLRPYSLIAWRRYGAIGRHEIEQARDEFLQVAGADPKQIAREYKDAKARLRACEKAEQNWDRLAGLTEQRHELDLAREAMNRALMKLAKTRPRTVAGAAAVLAYLKHDIEIGSHEWQGVALGTITRALKTMGRDARAAA